jgi:signal peptide peptidase SppA
MTEDIFDSTEAIEEFKELMREPAARQAFVELRADKERAGVRMRYDNILRMVSETPWAIRPSMLGVIVDILAMRAEGNRFTASEIDARISAARRTTTPSEGGVAVIPVHGVIAPKADMFNEVSGGMSVQGFRGMFRDAMRSSEVSAIVFDVDSPGGMVDQVPEMAAEIRAARGTKPIVAVANTEAASAAYWLASQADEIVASKSSRVGSIGVVTVHEDHSAEAAAQGVSHTVISAGKFKAETSPFQPLTEDGEAQIQGMVDEYYGMFVKDVARGRGASVGAVRSGYGEGRILSARDALAGGLVDRIGSLEDVVTSLLRSGSTAGIPAAAIDDPDPEPAPEPLPEPILAAEEVARPISIDEELESFDAAIAALNLSM